MSYPSVTALLIYRKDRVMFEFQLVLFSLLAVGIITNKLHIISENGEKELTELLLNIILPCNIFASFLGGNSSILFKSINILIISIISQVICFIMARVLYIKAEEKKRSIMQYATAVSNFSFIGLPVISVIYGNEGVVLASVSQIVFRVTTWTFALRLLTPLKSENAFKKLLCNPCIIAVFVGIICMLLNITLPGFIQNAVTKLSSCTTPVCMLIIGYMLANIHIRDVFDPYAFFYAFCRLILLPFMVFILLRPFVSDKILLGITVIHAAMPAPTTSAILAEKYGKDAYFASKIIFISTLFSLITLPLWNYILNV